MNKIFLALAAVLCSFWLSSCHDEPDYKNTLLGNFEALADIIDCHYCFFEDKDIDWQEVVDKYRATIEPEMTAFDLFFICAAMLDELNSTKQIKLSRRYII